jgi:polysaccharide export outer membrane protein
MDSRRSARILFGVFFFVASALALHAQDNLPRVASKDSLRISVVGVAQLLPGPYLVDGEGQIDYPYLGIIPVRGLTAREVGAEISKRLVAKGLLVGKPQVTVDVVAGLNKMVSITGSVRSPGQITYGGTLTLFDALVRAGMPSADAGEEVLVIHPIVAAAAPKPDAPAPAGAAGSAGDVDPVVDDSVIRVSLRDVERGDPAANLVLQDGDRIFVPKAQAVFISGEVQSPGAYSIQAGTTLLQALTLAGGISERGSTRGIRILRKVEGESKTERVENVTMETLVKPGDTIIVGRRIL